MSVVDERHATHDLQVHKCPGCGRELRVWSPKVFGIGLGVSADHEGPLCARFARFLADNPPDTMDRYSEPRPNSPGGTG